MVDRGRSGERRELSGPLPGRNGRAAHRFRVAVAPSRDYSRRCRSWLDLLVSSKRNKALDEPELFATYIEPTADARDVVRAHVDTLVGQLERIISDGVADGAFEKAANPVGAARAVFDATARFHNPVHASTWGEPGIDAAYEGVRALVLSGLERKRPRGRT